MIKYIEVMKSDTQSAIGWNYRQPLRTVLVDKEHAIQSKAAGRGHKSPRFKHRHLLSVQLKEQVTVKHTISKKAPLA